MINTRAIELWHRITCRKSIQELTAQYRAALFIPPSGFKDITKCDLYLKNASKRKHGLRLIDEYLAKCRTDITIPNGLTRAMMIHLVNNQVSYKDIDFSECKLDLSEYFSNGMIKIEFGPHTPIKEIKRFISKKSKRIRWYQKYYIKDHELTSPKRPRDSTKNSARDGHIYFFGTTYSKRELLEELKEIDLTTPESIFKYKPQIISELLKKGLGISVSPEHVKIIIRRQKALRENPRNT